MMEAVNIVYRDDKIAKKSFPNNKQLKLYGHHIYDGLV